LETIFKGKKGDGEIDLTLLDNMQINKSLLQIIEDLCGFSLK
jgi:hypothetical protein